MGQGTVVISRLTHSEAKYIIAVLAMCVLIPAINAQTNKRNSLDRIPPILLPTDQELLALMRAAAVDADSGEYDAAYKKLRQSFELSKTKKSKEDIAKVEGAYANAESISGSLSNARTLNAEAQRLANDTDNLALQASLLINESTFVRAVGRNKDAERVLVEAVEKARGSKEPYVLANALGELGGTRFTIGDVKGGTTALEEAIQIDRANNYPFLAVHTFYSALAIVNSDLPGARAKMDQALELAKQDDNYPAIDLISTTLAAFYAETKDMEAVKKVIEDVGKGQIPGLSEDAQGRARAALATPLLHSIFLNLSAFIYEHAGDKANAFKTRIELLDYAKTHEMTHLYASTSFSLAESFRAENDTASASKYYALSAQAWKSIDELQQAHTSLLRQGDLLLNAHDSVGSKAVTQQLIANSKALHDVNLESVGWMGLAQAYSIDQDWKSAQNSLAEAETLYLANPDKVDRKTALQLYIGLALNAGNQKDDFRGFLEQEKALVLAANLNDQKVLDLLVPSVAAGLKFFKVEEDSQEQVKKHNPFGVLHDEEIIAAYDINAPKWTKFHDSVRPISEHYARVFQLTKILLEQGTPQSDFDDLLRVLGPIHGSLQAPFLSGYVSHFSSSDPKKAETYAVTAIEGPWKDFNYGSYTNAWLACAAGTLALQTGALDRAHQQVAPCTQKASETHDRQLITMSQLLRASDKRTSEAENETALKTLSESQPTAAYAHIGLGWTAYQAGRYDTAIKEWETARSLEPNQPTQAQILIDLSWAYDARGQNDDHNRAQSDLNQALHIYQEAKDAKGMTLATQALAEHSAKVGDKNEARKFVDRAVQLAREASNSELIATSLSDSAGFYSSNGDHEKALRERIQAAAEFGRVNDFDRQAFQTYLSAVDLRALHRNEEARTALLNALSIAKQATKPETRYWIHKDYGRLLVSEGEFEEGIQQYEVCLQTSHEIADKKYEMWALESLANNLQELGDWERAESFAQDALNLARSLDLPKEQVDIHDTFINIYGSRESQIRDFEKAFEHLAAARELVRKLNDPTYQLISASLSELYFQTKRFDEGIANTKQVIEDCSRVRAIACEAQGWLALAEFYRAKGELRTARESLKRAGVLADKAADFYTSGYLVYAQAGQEYAEGRCSEASDLYKQVVGYIEKVRGGATSSQKNSVGESYSFVYDDLQQAMYCTSQQQPVNAKSIAWTALSYAESNKATAFTRDWAQIFLHEIKKDIPSDVLDEERKLTTRVNDIEQALLGEGSSSSETTDRDLGKAKQELESLITRLRSQYPKYAAIKYPKPVDPQSISLKDGEVLVDLKVTDTATYVWILANQGKGTELAHYYKIDKSREWFEDKIGALRKAFNVGTATDLKLTELDELLVALFPAAVRDLVFRAKRLIVLPDGAFYLLPFEILRLPDNSYPLADTAVTYEPSLAALSIAGISKEQKSWPQAYFGVGDPITELEDVSQAPTQRSDPPPITKTDLAARGFTLGRLPGTAIEVQKIATIFQDKSLSAEVRLGEAATKQQILITDLGRYEFLHFATHGIVPTSGTLREPALVFSYRGSDVGKMLLPISEIVRLKLNAEMVTLSACNTGTGRISRAEGVMNLGRAFLMAGSKNVTVSLWSVSDESTSLLMQEYYRQLSAGRSKGEALASARSLVRKNPKYSSPYYWGPFVLIGE